MTFHEFPKQGAMVVMRGNKVLAKAKYYRHYKRWLCRAYGFSWINFTRPFEGTCLDRGVPDRTHTYMKRLTSKKEVRELLKAIDH